MSEQKEYDLSLSAAEIDAALNKVRNIPDGVTLVSVTEASDGTVTMTNTFEDGSTETVVVSPDESGNPAKLTINGTEIPITWTEATA